MYSTRSVRNRFCEPLPAFDVRLKPCGSFSPLRVPLTKFVNPGRRLVIVILINRGDVYAFRVETRPGTNHDFSVSRLPPAIPDGVTFRYADGIQAI